MKGVLLGHQVSVAAPPETSIDAARGVVTSGKLTLAFHLAPDEATTPDQAGLNAAPQRASATAPGRAQVGSLGMSRTAAAARRRALQQQHAEPQDRLFEEQLAAIASQWNGSQARLLGREASRGQGGRGSAAAAQLGQHLFTVGISGEIMATKLALEPDAPARPLSYRLGITMGLDLPSLRIKVLPVHFPVNLANPRPSGHEVGASSVPPPGKLPLLLHGCSCHRTSWTGWDLCRVTMALPL